MKRRFVGLVAAALFSLGASSSQGNISTFFNTGSSGLAIDGQGNVYLTESSTARVRKISSGILSTIAGNGNFGYAGDGGQAISATLNLGTGGLSGLAVDSSGNVYFSDSSNNVIRKINTAGLISTYAGNGTGAGFGGFAGDNGPATSSTAPPISRSIATGASISAIPQTAASARSLPAARSRHLPVTATSFLRATACKHQPPLCPGLSGLR